MPDAAVQLSGRVQGGKLKIRAWRSLSRWRDGEVTITIARKHATRSLSQNAYYWGVVLFHLSDYTGYTQDELHEYLKLRFNHVRLVLCDRQGIVVDDRVVPQTTTTLNKVTFGEYVEQVRRWAAADLGLVIPDPDPDPTTRAQPEWAA
jgi:hypothetical protein